MTQVVAPARRVLQRAQRQNHELGHENLGFLSESHGFFPRMPPIRDLPAPYSAWLEIADALPSLWADLGVRRAVRELPRLDARAGALEDRYLLRASSVLGILAQSYFHSDPTESAEVPDCVIGPWHEVAQRLGKPLWTMTTVDSMFYNWRAAQPLAPGAVRVENLSLLTRIWDHPGLDVFMLTLVEMLARATPLVTGVARSQEALLRKDVDALKVELMVMSDTIARLNYEALAKINPNEHCGRHFVDAMAWAKRFGDFCLPMRPGVHNSSGVEAPFFHLMDEFLERRTYESQIGVESQAFRSAFPRNWHLFLAAARELSVRDFVDASGDRELQGCFQELLEAYQGPHGLLARHRLKAYGFLDTAFRTGRKSTVTGFSGSVRDRPWDEVDKSLEDARLERHRQQPVRVQFARIERVVDLIAADGPRVRQVVLDVRGLGLRYQAGDRLAVLPENDPGLVERTLAALKRANAADAPVELTADWRRAVGLRDGYDGASELPLHLLLTFGRIRPVSREAAKRLYAVSHSEALRRIVEQRLEDQWELWNLLDLLSDGGFDPRRLLSAHRGEAHHICRVVAPLAHRLYSISSVPERPDRPADTVELTVGHLTYRSAASPHTRVHSQAGTSSNYLCRDRPEPPGRRTTVWVVHPPRFSLPPDTAAPVVMIAGGTGIAPFRGLLAERARTGTGENLLVHGVRDASSVLYGPELGELVRAGTAEVRFALSREDTELTLDAHTGELVSRPGARARVPDVLARPDLADRLRALLVDGGGSVFVCGRADFARGVMDALADVLGGMDAIHRLIGEDRYLQDVFTTYSGSAVHQAHHVELSELLRANDPHGRMLMAISGRAYDMTDFAATHPGGARLIRSSAGTDATRSYRTVEHDANPEVDSMLTMFEVGMMRRVPFDRAWYAAIGDAGLQYMPTETLFRMWARFAYLVVEVENGFRAQLTPHEDAQRRERGGTPNAYELHADIDAHHGFAPDTLDLLLGEVGRLWWVTSGYCDPGLDVRLLAQRLERVRSSPLAGEAVGWTRTLLDLLAAHGSAGLPGEAALGRHVLALQEADLEFLHRFKAAVVDGIVVLETGRHATPHGRSALVDTLLSVVSITQDYFERVVAMIEEFQGHAGTGARIRWTAPTRGLEQD